MINYKQQLVLKNKITMVEIHRSIFSIFFTETITIFILCYTRIYEIEFYTGLN